MSTADRPPWQLSRAEWNAAFDETRADWTGGQASRYGGMGRATSLRGLGSRQTAAHQRREALKMGLPDQVIGGMQVPARHRQVVAEALRRGYPVPAHVLAEYPELRPSRSNPPIVPDDLRRAQQQLARGGLEIHDRYRELRAPKEVKGQYRYSGDDIIGYAYSPDYFIKSDATGRGLRYYVKLANGAVVHPDELRLAEIEPSGAVRYPEAAQKLKLLIPGEKPRHLRGRDAFYNAIWEAAPMRWKGKPPEDPNVPVTVTDGFHSVTMARGQWEQFRQHVQGIKVLNFAEWAEGRPFRPGGMVPPEPAALPKTRPPSAPAPLVRNEPKSETRHQAGTMPKQLRLFNPAGGVPWPVWLLAGLLVYGWWEGRTVAT